MSAALLPQHTYPINKAANEGTYPSCAPFTVKNSVYKGSLIPSATQGKMRIVLCAGLQPPLAARLALGSKER